MDQKKPTCLTNNWYTGPLTCRQEGCPGTTCGAHLTLTSELSEQMFQMAHLLMMENNNYANLY